MEIRDIILEKFGLDASGSREISNTGCCEHDNETLGSIKGGEFPDYLNTYSFSRGLYSM